MASQMKQIKAIKDAIKKEDVATLRLLAIKHGFINDKLRKKAWPLVLGIKTIEKQKHSKHKNTKNIIKNSNKNSKKMTGVTGHKLLQIPALKISTNLPQICEESKSADLTPEYQQIEKDIKRSSLSFYNIKKGKKKSEASLSKILHLIFDGNDDMHYIQGFNDVTSVFYAVCNNEKLAQRITEKVGKTLLKDYVMFDKQINTNLLNIAAYKLIFDIIECHDCELNKLFVNNSSDDTNGNDFISISISWLITWFAHDIKDINIISRIYDYCLCSNDKFVSSYLCAALLIYLKNDLYLMDKKHVSLFEYFGDLKWNKLDFNRVIQLSQYLYSKYANELNIKHESNNSDKDSDSTDSPPVPITPYTPYTPYTPGYTPYDFETANKSNHRDAKMIFKRKIKGFIDDYFGLVTNEND